MLAPAAKYGRLRAEKTVAASKGTTKLGKFVVHLEFELKQALNHSSGRTEWLNKYAFRRDAHLRGAIDPVPG